MPPIVPCQTIKRANIKNKCNIFLPKWRPFKKGQTKAMTRKKNKSSSQNIKESWPANWNEAKHKELNDCKWLL